jgi:lactate permease
MQIILAILPIIIIFFLILILKWSPLKAISSALFALLLIVIFVWQMHPNWIFAAGLKGSLFALEIGFIIIGAIFFLSILEFSGFQEKIKNIIQNINQDKRVQVLIIAWAFTALLEGSAGFGAPAILAAALLIVLGFSIISAVTLSLIGGSLHTIFGAVGTPILFGFGAGLNSPEILNYLQIQGIPLIEFLKEITIHIALFNLFIGLLVCLILLIMLVLFFGKGEAKKIKYVLEMIPFLMIASFSVVVPAYLLAHYLGPELPSLVGGLIGLFFLLIITQKGWFLPKIEWDFDKIKEIKKESTSVSFFKIFKILLPYFFLALIIFISRIDFLPVEQWLINFSQISLNQILETDINYSFSPFYSLGILLLLSAGIISLFFHESLKQIKTAFIQSLEKTKKAILILILILIFVQILIYSGENLNNYQSIPLLLASTVADISGKFWPIFIPLIGALGAFITGSATVSNLLFGNFQANSALTLGADPRLFLTLQGLGAALGNMISLHNIIVVLTVVGQISKIGLIIKYNKLPLIFLCLLIGLFGFLIS